MIFREVGHINMLIPIEVEAEKVFGECGHFEHVVWPDSYLQCIAKLLGMYLKIHKPLDVVLFSYMPNSFLFGCIHLDMMLLLKIDQ